MAELDKIESSHLAREAWVYVRQSTMTQVREHTESLARQYELADRAQTLGWDAEQVRVVDEDLGRSGAEASARTGFQAMVAAVGLGQVGIVIGIEVSRLARRNADWYHLLDLCALTGTLIADADGLYHPGDYNDRLVLGLKGTISENELHLLRSRLDAGLRHKAARGELRQLLPVGLDYDSDDRVVLCADEAAREAIATVFTRFDELGSARQVLLSLRGDGLRLPRRGVGERRIRWAEATYPMVHDFLTNPAYAGAFVYGRTKTTKRLGADGIVATSGHELPIDQWEVCIVGHHEGYIDWERYLANRARLRANWRSPSGEGRGAVRKGRALLQGLVRCGKCGRKMTVGYSGEGTSPRYICAQGLRLYGSAQSCQSIGGRALQAPVIDAVFKVLEPATLAATAAALGEVEHRHAQRLRAFELAVERARYEAERARRQYDAVEPENRLVGRSLEREWEQRLVALRQAETDLAAQRLRRPAVLTDDEVAWLSHAGADLRGVFESSTTTIRQQKQLLRVLIDEVVVTVHRPQARAEARIVWEGGATTDFVVVLPRRGDNAPQTEQDTLEMIRRLARHYDDATIARLLARQGRMTATGLEFTKDRVGSLRRKYDIPEPPPTDVAPDDDDVRMVSVRQAQQLLGVSKATLYRWLSDGFIVGEQDTPGSPWRVRIDDDLRAKIVGEVPDGWVGLDQAASTLGVARQTVLDRISRGALDAVHVTRGRRRGLAIRLPTQERFFEPDHEQAQPGVSSGPTRPRQPSP